MTYPCSCALVCANAEDLEKHRRETGHPERGEAGAWAVMSLRDWFAGMAISSIFEGGWRPGSEMGARTAAEAAYLIADALLAERARGGDK